MITHTDTHAAAAAAAAPHIDIDVHMRVSHRYNTVDDARARVFVAIRGIYVHTEPVRKYYTHARERAHTLPNRTHTHARTAEQTERTE